MTEEDEGESWRHNFAPSKPPSLLLPLLPPPEFLLPRFSLSPSFLPLFHAGPPFSFVSPLRGKEMEFIFFSPSSSFRSGR